MELDLNFVTSRIRNFCVWLVFGVLLFAQGGCFDQEVRLTREQINQVDSMYLAERKVWTERLEDSCQVQRDLHLNHWIDSLKAKRQREIEKMLGR